MLGIDDCAGVEDVRVGKVVGLVEHTQDTFGTVQFCDERVAVQGVPVDLLIISVSGCYSSIDFGVSVN